MNPPAPACASEQNPNLSTFERHYRRRLRLPVRLNYDVQTKLAMFRRLLRRLPALPEGASVLDLGFGSGQMLLTFSRSCALGGADITPSAVAQMCRRAERRSYQAYRFECLDLDRETLPWADASVDMVICSHVLEHVADARILLGEIRRVLRPGGHLWLMIPINEAQDSANPLHVGHYTPESLEKLLGTFGLRVLAGETGESFSRVLERIAGSPDASPGRLRDVLRGKLIALLGACAVLVPPVWSLRCWGAPRDFGVLACRELSLATPARRNA